MTGRSRSYPILNDDAVEATHNINCRVNVATKKPAGPVIIADRPWEDGRVLILGTATYDREDGHFKMWYMCGGGHVAYATSKDGLIWEKPELDIVLWKGTSTNIVIERGTLGHYYEIFGVLKDERDPDPARRYKMGFVSIQRDYEGPHGDRYHPGQRRGLGTACSPDGTHWTLEEDFASHEICDVSHFFWDEDAGRFVLHGRTKLEVDRERWRSWGWGRAVTRIESEDFREWSEGEFVMAADSSDGEGTEIYSLSAFPYHGTYIGLVQVFRGLPDQGTLEIELASSSDSKKFARVEPRDAFIPEGGIGEWDRFNISVGNMPPVVVGDEMWFYYSGRTYRHSPYSGGDTGPSHASIGLARIGKGRFLALEASFDGGTIRTRAVDLDGSPLFLNADARFGSIKVELLDEEDRRMGGWQASLSGVDGTSLPVKFPRAGLQHLAGRRVKIEFTLVNARLFGFHLGKA